jgi:hypothetical protein
VHLLEAALGLTADDAPFPCCPLVAALAREAPETAAPARLSPLQAPGVHLRDSERGVNAGVPSRAVFRVRADPDSDASLAVNETGEVSDIHCVRFNGRLVSFPLAHAPILNLHGGPVLDFWQSLHERAGRHDLTHDRVQGHRGR